MTLFASASARAAAGVKILASTGTATSALLPVTRRENRLASEMDAATSKAKMIA